jgi:hypothetical protein
MNRNMPDTLMKHVKTQTSLKPGRKGTKRLVEQYGNALLCVRYRHDTIRGLRLKTVELVVEEKPYRPWLRYRDDDIVSVIVSYSETELRDRLKKACGKWNSGERLWRVLFGAILGDTELKGRILKE